MEFKSVQAIAQLWQISERTVRDYCSKGKIPGAFLIGKTWNIPANAKKPQRKGLQTNNLLLKILREQKEMRLKGGIYHNTQIELAYNSNHIEGSKLSQDQTRFIFETNTIGVSDSAISVDDIVETTNHFKAFDYILDIAEKKLSENMIKKLHFMLKSGTSDSLKDWFNVGEYKKFPNEVGGKETCLPENVSVEMNKLINTYNKKTNKSIEDLIEFHRDFETIHPFQDGNGRVGRLILFKECLKNNIVPFIITEDLKYFYYRGLKEWKNQRGYLIDTCLTAQDRYKLKLAYFKI